jgi:hypothetical protein
MYQPSTDGPPPVIDDADPFSVSLLEKAGLEGRRRDRRRAERRRRQLPPAVPASDTDTPQPKLSDEDTEILGWLTDDDVTE